MLKGLLYSHNIMQESLDSVTKKKFEKLRLSLHQEYSPLFHQATENWLTINLQAPDNPSYRKSLRQIFIIDTSASMSVNNKMEYCRKALGLVIRESRPDDEIGIITYNDKSSILFPITKMDLDGKKSLQVKLDSIKTNGATNLSEGIRQAFHIIRDISPDTKRCQLNLITDGHPTKGISRPQTLCRFIKHLQAGCNHICQFNCFGVGIGHDSKLLLDLSCLEYENLKQGLYYFIQDTHCIPLYLQSLMGDESNLFAEDIKVKAVLKNGCQITKVETLYPYEKIKDSINMKNIKSANPLFIRAHTNVLEIFKNHFYPMKIEMKRV